MVGLQELRTPALLVDRPRLLANLREMANRAAALGIALRPHVKTHKSPAIAALQRDGGAVGLTVATVTEAECFAARGHRDLLITTPPVGRWRLERIVALARRGRIRVSVDDAGVVAALEQACRRGGVEVGFLWELDCGAGRFGSVPGRASAELIARVADGVRHCSFDGLLTFPGHAYAATDIGGVVAAAEDEREAIVRTADELEARGVEVRVRSVGSTPTAHLMSSGEGITEMRPGNYAFYDATQTALGVVAPDRCALSVLATVVSRPSRDRLILDSGSKALAAERLSTLTPGYGMVVAHPELRVERLYEEQAVVYSDRECSIPVGARVRVVPNHACAAVNLHSELVVLEEEEIVERWAVEARGWGSGHERAGRDRLAAAMS